VLLDFSKNHKFLFFVFRKFTFPENSEFSEKSGSFQEKVEFRPKLQNSPTHMLFHRYFEVFPGK